MSQAEHSVLYNQTTNTGGSRATLNVTADEQTLPAVRRRGRGALARLRRPHAISPLRALAPAGSDISYAPGVDWLGTVVPEAALGSGLTRTQDTCGLTRTQDTSADTRVDRTLNHTGEDGLAPARPTRGRAR